MLESIPPVPGNLLLNEPVPEIRRNVGMAGLAKKGNIHRDIQLRLALHTVKYSVVCVEDDLKLSAALTSITTLFDQLLFQLKEAHLTLVRIVFVSCVCVCIISFNPYIVFIMATVIQILALKGK